MSIDNIQELMKPRYKAIDGYPCSPYSIGDMVEFSTSGTSFLCTRTQQYDDFREDIVDVDNYFTIDALDKYPNLFRRLEWWEYRDVKDMPEYVKQIMGTNKSEVYKIAYPSQNGRICHEEREIEHGYFLRHAGFFEPATETEYLNQTTTP